MIYGTKDPDSFDRWLDDATPAEWDRAAAMIKKPTHYTTNGVECIDYIRQQVDDFASYCEGNIIKYVHRYKNKGGPVDDLRKARQYLDWLIAEVTKVE